jgi:hypothetical protein
MILLENLILEYIHKNHRVLRYNKKLLNILIENIHNNQYHLVYCVTK